MTLDLAPNAPKRFQDILTGRHVRSQDFTAAHLFETLPVAVLQAR
jgi:hypothetical protein